VNVTSTGMNDRLNISVTEHVAHVRLARPASMNALDDAMFDALVNVREELSKHPVRCIVLSGEGPAFCAGLDKSLMSTAADDGPKFGLSRALKARTHGIANREQYAALIWRELPVPVIAAIHGVAFGGGLQIALGADMRYVAADAKLSIMEIKWGLVPDMAGTVLMRGLVRDDVARELTYTGRIFSGTEALSYGIATRVCSDPVADALATAHDISQKSPAAIRAAKRLRNGLSDRDTATQLLKESIEQEQLMRDSNHGEAVAANLANRAPKFSD
jgi:enoyl-CoA hydratase/carnithine racemase